MKNINGHFPLFDPCFRELYSRKMWLTKSVTTWFGFDQDILVVDEERITLGKKNLKYFFLDFKKDVELGLRSSSL